MTEPTRLVANNLFDLIIEALGRCSKQQATMFRLVYGIEDDGVGEPREVSEAARMLGLNKYTAHITLARARAAVFEHVAGRQVDQMRARLEVWFGEEFEDQPEGLRAMRHGRGAGMLGSVTLGEGSEAHAMVETRSFDAGKRKQARIDAHRKYANGGDA